ncbi:MAG TPA: diguanylate cyclase [Candidatus Aminicenantes bacterium]|nr:diguanylate cyclase [Candidatus Aminicenantes bacterium]HRY65773.1 diguanylate cyclase [Candidatus Aminicenantes bacterium]HRZ72687.1 diguanylate cyclase [Candidatus Aminicenantes bacterium]
MNLKARSKRRLAPFVFAAVLAASAAPAAAAELPGLPPPTKMSFEAFKLGQGRGTLIFNLLVQDSDGFIWAATENGLFRYDGARFELFDASRGIPDDRANALCLDAKGDLWVGLPSGLFRRQGEAFAAVGRGLPDGVAVNDIAAGADGRLWLATDKGLFEGDAAAGFRACNGWTDSLAQAVSYAQASGRLWAVGKDDLWRLDPGGRWSIVDRGGAASRDGLERALEDGQGRVWIRSSNFLWRLDPGEAQPRLVDRQGRSDGPISRMYVDTGGTVWAPNETGLARLERGAWVQWDARDGLPTDFSRAVLVDREGSLWLGGLGLYRLVNRGVWRSATSREGLPAPVWSFLRTADGQIWVGTQKGLARLAYHGWEVVPGSQRFCARSLAASPDGLIYMAGDPAKVMSWDPRSGELATLPLAAERSSRIYYLLCDGPDRLWLGTSGDGLMKASRSAGGWQAEFVRLPGGSERESVYHLLLDRSGRLWACGEAGLACLEGDRWTRFTKRDGLLADDISYIIETTSGEFWIAYYEKFGISRVRLEGGRLRVMQTISPGQGLSSGDVFLLGFDVRGRLWVGTDRGVDVIEGPASASRRVRHFGGEEGLVDEQTDAMAFLADPNGDCWIGTRSGIGHFVAALPCAPPSPPPTVILRASLGGQPVPVGAGEPVRVRYRANDLSAYYATPSYIYGDSVEHEMRLVGLENRWIAAAGHEIRYPGLRPGDYRLEIRSRTGRGDWGTAVVMPFVISSPWWRTIWARLGLIAGLLALAYLILNVRTLALRRRAERLEAVVGSRTRELALRTEQLAAANETLRDLSLTDALTGLRNRRFLDLTLPEYLARVDRVHHEIGVTRRAAEPANVDLMLAMLDMDLFKAVNDEYGHDAGDRVLTQVASVLLDAVRDTDTVVRWGGEEFLLVLRNACRGDGGALAERFRRRVASHPFDLGGGRVIRCTCSIGFSFYPVVGGRPGSFSWENVVEMADRCLLAAKRSGRDAWVGIAASPGADPNELTGRLPTDLVALVLEGSLRAATSLGAPSRIVWGPLS